MQSAAGTERSRSPREIAAVATSPAPWTVRGNDAAAKAPTDGQEFMQYLSEIGVSQSTRHTLRDKEVFTVSSWMGVI